MGRIENEKKIQIEYKYEIIAKYKYENKNYLIIYEREKNNLNFTNIDEFGNLSILDDNENEIAIEIFKNLTVNKENSRYLMNDIINGNKYNIYLSKKNNIFFWENNNGIDKKEDNYIMNYKYNCQLDILATAPNLKKNKKGEYFIRLMRIKNKLVPILLIATMNLSFFSGCTVQGENIKESIQSTQIESTQKNRENNNLSFEEKSAYSWEKIQKIIAENNNLAVEEKEFLYKFKFLFEEEHQYMDMLWVYEDLKDFKFEYDESNCKRDENIGGEYHKSEHKIVFYRANSWKDVNYSIAIHEFLHLLQGNGTYLEEIMCEGKSREVMHRFINDGNLDENDLEPKGIIKEIIQDQFSNYMKNSNFELMYNTKLIFKDRNYGYYRDMWIYYVFQKMVSKESFDRGFYDPTYIYGLREYADSDEELNELFWKEIDMLREGDYHNRHEVYKKLNKYYNRRFDKDIVEDLELYVKSFYNTAVNSSIDTLPYFDENCDNIDIVCAQERAVLYTIREEIEGKYSVFQYGQEFLFQEDDKGNIVAIALKRTDKDATFGQCLITKELANKYRENLEESFERYNKEEERE